MSLSVFSLAFALSWCVPIFSAYVRSVYYVSKKKKQCKWQENNREEQGANHRAAELTTYRTEFQNPDPNFPPLTQEPYPSPPHKRKRVS